jgi:hypothetical protein
MGKRCRTKKMRGGWPSLFKKSPPPTPPPPPPPSISSTNAPVAPVAPAAPSKTITQEEIDKRMKFLVKLPVPYDANIHKNMAKRNNTSGDWIYFAQILGDVVRQLLEKNEKVYIERQVKGGKPIWYELDETYLKKPGINRIDISKLILEEGVTVTFPNSAGVVKPDEILANAYTSRNSMHKVFPIKFDKDPSYIPVLDNILQDPLQKIVKLPWYPEWAWECRGNKKVLKKNRDTYNFDVYISDQVKMLSNIKKLIYFTYADRIYANSNYDIYDKSRMNNLYAKQEDIEEIERIEQKRYEKEIEDDIESKNIISQSEYDKLVCAKPEVRDNYDEKVEVKLIAPAGWHQDGMGPTQTWEPDQYSATATYYKKPSATKGGRRKRTHGKRTHGKRTHKKRKTHRKRR